MNKNYIGENVKYFREKENLSLKKCSYRCETSSYVLGNIEEYKTLDPQIASVIGIAKAMNARIDDLVNKDFKEVGIDVVSNTNMTDDYNHWKIKENINNFIEHNNLKISDVAKMFNINDLTVISLRNEKKKGVRLNLCYRMARAMNITIDQLLFEEIKF